MAVNATYKDKHRYYKAYGNTTVVHNNDYLKVQERHGLHLGVI